MRLRQLPHKLKGLACFALSAAVLSGSLMISGCSTPKYAATFDDGTKITTAEYIAYLFNAYQMTFNYSGLGYYAQSGQDVWGEELAYGEGDDAEKLKLEDYIKRLTKDTILRQKAIA
ncbi:MAG TPA: hypothetical protein DEB10_05740, partial [Ruminococcaceae bacterium]|nr:hypothetical protein [Oscillospiraceae bacterium]